MYSTQLLNKVENLRLKPHKIRSPFLKNAALMYRTCKSQKCKRDRYFYTKSNIFFFSEYSTKKPLALQNTCIEVDCKKKPVLK